MVSATRSVKCACEVMGEQKEEDDEGRKREIDGFFERACSARRATQHRRRDAGSFFLRRRALRAVSSTASGS